MFKCFLLFCFLGVTCSLFAQQTKTIEQKINNKVVKHRFEVLVDQPEIKHGAYESYYYNGKLKEKGNYIQDKKDGKWLKVYDNQTIVEVQYFEKGNKVGIWEKHLERNQVVELFDQEQQKKLDPIIQNVIAKYPPLAREDSIEGTVEVLLKLRENCSVEELKVVKDIGYECGESALEAVERIAFLKKKYNIGTCNPNSEVIKVEFKLE